jgi:hypothetical protein
VKHSGMRKAGAVVAGVVVAGMVIGLAEAGAHAAVSGDGLFAAACVAQGAGAAAGGGLAAKLGGSGMLAWVVAAVLLALSLVNVFSFAHPGWFVPVVVLALGAGGRLGIAVASRPEEQVSR